MRGDGLRLACLALGSLVAITAAEAQKGGSAIRGRITDQQQGVLPGVAIVVTFDFFFEAFNVTNEPNFANPG